MKGNIHKYYTFQVFRRLTFFNTVLVLFFLSRGLSLTQITLVQSIHSIGALLSEIPCGAFADYFGNRKSLILGSFIWAITLFLYGASYGFWAVAVAAFIGGIGQAFMSGADSTFIHETLKSIDRDNEYKKVEGKAKGLSSITQSLGLFFGGFIASFSLAATFFVSSFTSLLATVVSILFKEPRIKEEGDTPKYGQIIIGGIKAIHQNKVLLWLTFFVACLNGLYWTANLFAQPYLQSINIPIVYFGIIFAAFNILSSIASMLVHKFEFLSGRNGILGMIGTMAVGLILIGTFPNIFVFSLWSLFEIVSSMSFIIVSAEVLHIVERGQAATVLSFQSLAIRFVNIIVSPILGFIADKLGIFHALQINGLLLLFAFVIMIFMLPKRLPQIAEESKFLKV